MVVEKFPGRWSQPESDGRLLCLLCPRACRLKPGDRGFCFVRQNVDGEMILDTYGKSTGFCIDPIEKKPLNHFLPGTPVLSFGTAGCNLGCKFCQNWEISKSREVARLSDHATPEMIANAANQTGCRSVAFTYNDPVIWAEYAIDTARVCRQAGIRSVAVTAGYITPEARGEFFQEMDAANIDLKGFSEEFYYGTTASHLQPVLDTIRYVVRETDCWVELTNLIIPGANDDRDELSRMCDWIVEAVGSDVPIHFTAFHPDFRMNDRPATPHETLVMAYDLAKSRGVRYPYVGNVHDIQRQSTLCHACGNLLIERDWHALGRYTLNGNSCGHCGTMIPGRFELAPGTWGRRRQPIRISQQPVPQRLPVTAMPHPSTPPSTLEFTPGELKQIHRLASQWVIDAVLEQAPRVASLEENLVHRLVCGVYVTLKRGETLRGCCGSLGSERPLGDVLRDAAYRTAKEDPRMPSIDPVELPYLNLSISILGPSRPIGAQGDARVEHVEVGKHGLRIQLGDAAGLLLPSVPVDQEWDSRQFLDGVCRKAGLPAGAWRRDDVDLRLFDGVAMSEPLVLEAELPPDRGSLTVDDAARLAEWVRDNLVAMASGGTPTYVASGVADVNALGMVLQVRVSPDAKPLGWMHLNLRQTAPMMSTLYKLTEHAVRALGANSVRDCEITVAALGAAVHHGPRGAEDLRGLDPARRALLVTDSKRWSLSLNRTSELESTLQEASSARAFRSHGTQVYSLRCTCNRDKLHISIAPRGQASITNRPPAVAGTFYPASDMELATLLDSFASELDEATKEQASAIMVPHAGLKFSGRIAFDTWRRIGIPRNVLIIGPKHTADGVDWAVAPHDRWLLSPTSFIEGAPMLAQSLCQAVPQFELDAAAHAREHGIEVELPILKRLAPDSHVIAIAMHGGTIDELQVAAQGLANWMQSLDELPLLVISSDMNHFADEEENRRRDRLALDAMRTLDATQLLETCEHESISMCGQIPAALVMLTLRALGRPMSYREIGYGTSAEATGDRSRVVGYAGVLL